MTALPSVVCRKEFGTLVGWLAIERVITERVVVVPPALKSLD